MSDESRSISTSRGRARRRAPPSVQDTVLQDGDVVKVFGVTSRDEKVVRLEGHVYRPGKYEWKPGMRLKDVVTSL